MSLMNMISGIDSQVGDNDEIVLDESNIEQNKENIKRALNDYINERLMAVSDEYKRDKQP